MGNPQFSVFMPLFGKQWVKSCIAYTGKSCPQLMLMKEKIILPVNDHPSLFFFSLFL